MNLRKHLAGLLIFSIILGSAIFINHVLTLPNPTISSIPRHPLIADVVENSGISYTVRMVSLDLTDRTRGYTVLRLKLLPGQPAPQKLWVTTFYFSPDIVPGGSWSSTTEFSQPFAKGDEVEVVASDAWNWTEPPGADYFARVSVSTGNTDDSYPPDIRFDRNVNGAIPVVIQWPNN